MKQVCKIIFTFLIITIFPYSILSGQEKKNEQRIKIIVADGSDTKVVIDTLLNDGMINDSIRLKDGKVIFIGHAGDKYLTKSHGNNKHVFVNVTSDGDNTGKEVKEITVISSDSLNLTEKGEHGNVFFYTDDNKESDVEKTRYVIAKDGMVVTVEGTDETKAKELIREIEKKLGVKSAESEKLKPVKTETKKSSSR